MTICWKSVRGGGVSGQRDQQGFLLESASVSVENLENQLVAPFRKEPQDILV